MRRPSRTNTPNYGDLSDPTVPDPPIVAALAAPLYQLRASLGSGAAEPHEALTAALTGATAHTAATEDTHRAGIHGVEATNDGAAASAAVPALRATAAHIGTIADRGPAVLAVTQDAHTTTSTAAARVDRIIDRFRSDARQIMGSATSAPDTDAVIDRAAEALRDAVTTVTAARTEMADHTRRLDALRPTAGAIDDDTTTTTTTTTSSSWTPPASLRWSPTTPSSFGGYSAAPMPMPVTTAPMDPATAAQVQMQAAALSAGVQLGTTALQAGVQIGTDIVDKIAEVATHGIDAAAKVGEKAVDQAVPALLNGDKTKPGNTDSSTATTDSGTSTGTGTGTGALFDFGGHSGTTGTSGAAPAGHSQTGLGSLLPDTKPDTPPPAPAQSSSPPPPTTPDPAPAPPPATTPAPGPADHAPAPSGGAVLPPQASGGGDHDKRPRTGQFGVTTHTAPASAVAPVIGKHDG